MGPRNSSTMKAYGSSRQSGRTTAPARKSTSYTGHQRFFNASSSGFVTKVYSQRLNAFSGGGGLPWIL